MYSSTINSHVSVTPAARALFAEICAATKSGRAFPDFPIGDARNNDVEELAAELLIEPVAPENGGGWLAAASE